MHAIRKRAQPFCMALFTLFHKALGILSAVDDQITGDLPIYFMRYNHIKNMPAQINNRTQFIQDLLLRMSDLDRRFLPFIFSSS